MTKRTVDVADPKRLCPECGKPFTATHGRQVFCCTEHQERFHTVMKVRGKVALPFMLVWRTGKRGSTADTSYAFGQMAALADQWNAEDKAAGRRPDLIVAAKAREGWLAVDIGPGRRTAPNCYAPARAS